jgi:hypothetical protein
VAADTERQRFDAHQYADRNRRITLLDDLERLAPAIVAKSDDMKPDGVSA